jgi:glycosyltransferase involved in cell wall biosynthesis
MEPVRGVHTLVDAAALLVHERGWQDLVLTVAWNGDGDPGYERRIRAQVRARGLDAYMRWVGVVPDLGALYEDHDLVVIPPTTHERMGFPLRLVEALSYGRPVVVSDVGELPLAADGCGVVFPREDARALAAGVERLLTNPQLYRRSAGCALLRARLYDPATIVARIAEVYRDLLGPAGGGRR